MEEYDHVYKNPDGTAAYCKHRVKYADGSKVFRFRYVDEHGKTVFKKPEGCNNLYNLDLLERADADTCLYIVEGEKCADAMVQHGFLATTCNAGARKNVKLSPTDLRYLNKFSEIVLIPDNDDKGADYAKAWPVPVEVLDLTEIWPDCPAKGDVADYFARGGDPSGLSVSVDYSNVSKKEIIGMRFYESLYAIKNENRRQYAVSVAEQRARELNIARQFSKGWQTFLRSKAKAEAGEKSKSDDDKSKASSHRNEVNTEIQKILSKAGIAGDVINATASFVSKNIDKDGYKQLIYRGIIKEHGQKMGLELYRLIKGVL